MVGEGANTKVDSTLCVSATAAQSIHQGNDDYKDLLQWNCFDGLAFAQRCISVPPYRLLLAQSRPSSKSSVQASSTWMFAPVGDAPAVITQLLFASSEHAYVKGCGNAAPGWWCGGPCCAADLHVHAFHCDRIFQAPAGASQLATWLLFVGSCVTTHFAAKGVALCRAPAGARQLATSGPQNVGCQPLVLCIVLLLVAVLLPGTLYTSRASHAKND